MATTGFILPTANNDDDGSYAAWNNPDNAHTGTDAAFSIPDGGSSEAAWFWTGFDFAGAGLSSGDTINGIEFQVRTADNYNDETWHLELGHDATTNVADDYTINRMPAAGNCYTSASPDTFTIGGASDKLNFPTITADDLLAASYNVLVQLGGSGLHAEDSELYWLKVNVHYTAAGGGGTTIEVPTGPWR